MVTLFNPFGRGQGTAQAGSADAAGRGRGSSARGSHFQSRGSRGRRASKWRGATQGVGRGRGAGAGGTTGAPHLSTSTADTDSPASASSPFARLHQQEPAVNPFGGQQTQRRSPFSSMANPSATRGTRGASRGASRQNSQRQPGETAGDGSMPAIPVEDASILASYHERYEQLKVDRAQQRQRAIRDGQMADPNQPTSLKQAITPVGTCTSMCPEFERVERIVQKMVDKSEKYLHPSTHTLQNMETKMLKRFRRSAAGYDEQLPSDIRTPKTLLQSTNYLIRHVIGGSEPLGIMHKFVWDRTRSIRNDFSVQQLTHEEDVKIAVTCLERIARFHIVSLHLLSSPANEEPFDRHQEREQLNNTMLSLMYYYDDNRGRIVFPNEAEFRAYYIIFSIHDQRPDLEARVQKWPASLLNSPRVQVALDLYAASCNTWEYQGTLDARRPNAIAQGFYTRFFNIINSPSVSYLMACVAEIYFNHVRQTAIRAIWRGYCRQPVSQQHKNEEWTVDELTRVLHFDDDEQTIKFCEGQDLELTENANGQLYLNWGSRPVDSVAFQPSSEHAYSDTYVENKRAGRSLVAVILGMDIREAARMGMIDPSSLRSRFKTLPSAPTTHDNDLFVSADGNQIPDPVVDMASPSLDGHPNLNASASESQQPVQQPAAPAPVNPFARTQPTQPTMSPTGQPPNPFQTTKPPNPFSSLFSGAAAPTNTPATTSPAPSPFAAPAANALSPFTPSSSPFSFPTSATVWKEETPAVAAPVATQSPSLFSTGSFATTTPAPASMKPNPFAASSASFMHPKPSEPGQTQAPTSTAAQPFPLFSGGGVPKSAPTPFAASPSPFAVQKSVEPSQVVTPPQPTSPFPTTKPFFASAGPKDNQSAAETAVKQTASISQPSLASSVPAPESSSVFNFAKTTTPSQTEEKASATTATGQTFQPSGVFPTAQPSVSAGLTQPSLFQPKAPAPEQKMAGGTMFAPTSATQKLAPAFPTFGPAAGTSSITPPQQPLLPTVNAQTQPLVQNKVPEAQPSMIPSFAQPKQPESTTPAGSPEPVPTAVNQVPELKPSAKSLPATTTPTIAATERTNPYDPYTNPEERKAAWEKFIARRKSEVLAHEQARALAQERKRNRALEAQAAAEAAEEEADRKTAEASEPQETQPVRRSLMQKYLEEIPELPILKRTRELLEKKPPTEEEIEAVEPKPNLIDQDELLLNNARIWAEKLRRGPRLLDAGMLAGLREREEKQARWEALSNRLGEMAVKYRNKVDAIEARSREARSRASSRSYSQSISPPTHGYSHGHKVAYAPDPPPGGSLSRTEQRIRRTGARGLAYKPLNFPEKRDEDKKRKTSFTQSELEDKNENERRKKRRDSSTQTD